MAFNSLRRPGYWAPIQSLRAALATGDAEERQLYAPQRPRSRCVSRSIQFSASAERCRRPDAREYWPVEHGPDPEHQAATVPGHI